MTDVYLKEVCFGMGVQDKVSELVSAIKSTREYIELKQSKEAIDRIRHLRMEVDDFNRRQARLYSRRLSAGEAEAIKKELNAKFSELSKIPEIERYLRASRQFTEMMGNVFRQINDSLTRSLG